MNGQLEATASIPDDGFIKGRVESSRISSSIGFMMSGTTKDFDAIYNNLEDTFTGIIDEFKIYNRALSSSEILSDFNTYEIEDFTVQQNLNYSGLFPIPILNGSFDTDKILLTNLFHDWMKFGSISLFDKDENPGNTLGKKSVELKKVNWANKSSIYQQIGYFKNDLNFKVNFKTALGKRGGYAGCRINIYVGGSNVYNDLELSSSTLGVTPPTRLFSYEVPSGTFPSSDDWIEITTDDFDFQTLSTSFTENAPLYIEFETTTSQAGDKTLLDDIDVEVTRTSVDTTVPVITLLGDATVTVEVGNDYTDAGATASDNYDGDITDDIVVVNPVDTDVVGSYSITYNVSDAAGNAAVEAIREVIVENSLTIGDDLVKSINIYPNPFSEKVIISSESLVDVSVYNILGSVVLKEKSVSVLNTSALQQGVYIFKLEYQGLETYVKMVK
jgi:hypothetical protein